MWNFNFLIFWHGSRWAVDLNRALPIFFLSDSLKNVFQICMLLLFVIWFFPAKKQFGYCCCWLKKKSMWVSLFELSSQFSGGWNRREVGLSNILPKMLWPLGSGFWMPFFVVLNIYIKQIKNRLKLKTAGLIFMRWSHQQQGLKLKSGAPQSQAFFGLRNINTPNEYFYGPRI